MTHGGLSPTSLYGDREKPGTERATKLILVYYVPPKRCHAGIPPWTPNQKQSSLAPGFSWSLDRRSAARTATFATLSPARSRTEPQMRLTHFFIDRPRFAVVLSTFVTLLGLVPLPLPPFPQYPALFPPPYHAPTPYPAPSAQ